MGGGEQGMAHTIVETEKSYSLLPTSWRPRGTQGTVCTKPTAPENQGSQWCKRWLESKGWRTIRTGIPYLGQEKVVSVSACSEQVFPSSAFCSMQALKDDGVDDAHPLYSVCIQMLISSGNTHRHTQK